MSKTAAEIEKEFVELCNQLDCQLCTMLSDRYAKEYSVALGILRFAVKNIKKFH